MGYPVVLTSSRAPLAAVIGRKPSRVCARIETPLPNRHCEPRTALRGDVCSRNAVGKRRKGSPVVGWFPDRPTARPQGSPHVVRRTLGCAGDLRSDGWLGQETGQSFSRDTKTTCAMCFLRGENASERRGDLILSNALGGARLLRFAAEKAEGHPRSCHLDREGEISSHSGRWVGRDCRSRFAPSQ